MSRFRNFKNFITLRTAIISMMVVIALVGIFGVGEKAHAQPQPAPEPRGICVREATTGGERQFADRTETECRSTSGFGNTIFKRWVPNQTQTPGSPTPPTPSGSGDALDRAVGKLNCVGFEGWSLEGCFVKIFYLLFYTIPAQILILVANMFNAMLGITLSSKIYTASTFIPDAWRIVRDISNIFFILILIYTAVKLILGLSDHGVKKTIVQVIIMALLINFSLFFTKVVIDTSNILALIFYNKISMTTPDGRKPPYESIFSSAKTGVEEKDISGGIVAAFNPTRLTSDEMFARASDRETTSLAIKVLRGVVTVIIPPAYFLLYGGENVPVAFFLMMIIVSCVVFLFTAYVFFVAAWAFLDRLIRLWVLIIVSPFAFMSSAIPLLSKIEHAGWDSWLKELMKTAFLAPIFMFFLYIISQIISIDIFKDWGNLENNGLIANMLLIVIPTFISLMMLNVAVNFAKKGSGKLGEMMSGVAKVATGLVVGGGIGVTAAALQGTIGHAGKAVFDNKALKEAQEKGGWLDRRFARGLRKIAGGDDGKGGLGSASFDLRRGAGGLALKAVSAATGANLGAGSTFLQREAGGYVADLKRRDEKAKKQKEGLKVTENEKEKQDLNEAEENGQTLKLAASHQIDQIKKQMDAARVKENDLAKQADALKNTKDPEKEKAQKAALEEARALPDTDPTKSTKIAAAQAMDVNDPEKVEAKEKVDEARKQVANFVIELREQKSLIQGASAANADALATNATDLKKIAESARTMADAAKVIAEGAGATKEDKAKAAYLEGVYKSAETAAKSAETAAKVAELSKKQTGEYGGKSIDELDEEIIPELKHAIEHLNKERARAFATNYENEARFYNRAARRKTAHEIRMDVKVEEKHDKGKSHFGEALGAEVVAALGKKVLGGGGSETKSSGDSHAPGHAKT